MTQQATSNKVISVLRVISARESDVGTLICRAVNQKVDTYTAQLNIDFVVGTLLKHKDLFYSVYLIRGVGIGVVGGKDFYRTAFLIGPMLSMHEDKHGFIL